MVVIEHKREQRLFIEQIREEIIKDHHNNMDTIVEKVYHDYESVDEIIHEKIMSNVQERAFYVLEMYDIYKKHIRWMQAMPRVKPFYAVKCNNLPEVVGFIASLGCGFDCASKQEIDQVLSYGVDPAKIIYANPCKTKYFVKHARNVKVDMMTFDNEHELTKIAQIHPGAKLVLRIKGNDRTSRCKFNVKFGADLANCYDLLKMAKQLSLNVMGVSFHNGSDCAEAEAYNQSIAACKAVFNMGNELGHPMSLLDIGGGFPGDNSAKVSFETLASNVNAALDTFFPAGCGVDIIAEPGRYYVASSMTLASMVIAKRLQYDDKSGQDAHMYYLNEGVYGAFNNVIFESATPKPQFWNHNDNDQRPTRTKRKLRSSIMWGPTCDSIDCIKRDFMFPELNVGEWVIFRNMGAYTVCVATSFNGFEPATVIIANKHFK